MRVWLFAVMMLLCGCRKTEKIVAPNQFRVDFETTKGNFTVEVQRDWSPHAADRFYELLKMGYFNESRFYRVVEGFIAQFGVHKKFDIHERWREYFILDDPRKLNNTYGTLVFAKSAPNTRAVEIFINLKDNPELDEQNFVPFAKIVQGTEVLQQLYAGYGEMRPEGKYIDPGRVEGEANEYMVPRFPKLDYIKRTRILQ